MQSIYQINQWRVVLIVYWHSTKSLHYLKKYSTGGRGRGQTYTDITSSLIGEALGPVALLALIMHHPLLYNIAPRGMSLKITGSVLKYNKHTLTIQVQDIYVLTCNLA